MARSVKRPRPLLSFNHPVQITVRATKFKWLDSVRHLNLASLAKAARAEVEVGEVATGCCQHLIRAVIRKGMVTRLEIEPISRDARTPLGTDFRKLLAVVKQRLRATRPPQPRFPVPVPKFFEADRDPDPFGITVITCIEICVFGWCISCCFHGDIAICGRVYIDGTDLPYPEPPGR